MANEKIECLETTLESFREQLYKITKTLEQFTKSRMGYHQEVPSINEHIEGEFSHHIHFHGNHQHSHPQPPKLDMYKFDGSNLAVWEAQMEQYFTLNYIYDDQNKLRAGTLYLD